jgi:hypothetical protein
MGRIAILERPQPLSTVVWTLCAFLVKETNINGEEQMMESGQDCVQKIR